MSTSRFTLHLEKRPEDVFELLVNRRQDKLGPTLKYLQACVGRGHFSIAAEISEHIRTRFADALEREPSHLLTLELEHMKRLAYMGYDESAKQAAHQVIAEAKRLSTNRTVSKDQIDVASFTAHGQLFWLDTTDKRTQQLKKCQAILAGHSGSFKGLFEAFQSAMKGWDASLRLENQASETHFKTALSTLENLPDSFRSEAHVRARRADCLGQQGNATAQFDELKELLKLSTENTFSSHLLLRAITQILRLHTIRSIQLSETDQRFYCFQAWALIHGLGLNHHVGVCPLLSNLEDELKSMPGTLLSQAAYRKRLHGYLLTVPEKSGREWEKLLKNWYDALGYSAELLPEGEALFDLILVKEEAHLGKICAGVQSKGYSRKVNATNLPGDTAWEKGQSNWFHTRGLPTPCSIIWFCQSNITAPAKDLLLAKVSRYFWCKTLVTVDIDGLVDEMLQHPDALVRMLSKRSDVDTVFGA